jgi:hypothetical protein
MEVMAEIDNVLAELRHRIMGSLKPAQPQHQETNEEGTTTTPPSAAVALRRLAHPGRDGGAVVGDDPAPEPINPEQGAGAVVGDDPITPLAACRTWRII